jgi:hypothetical protein
MDRWEHFSREYKWWEDVQRDLATMGNDGWEAVSLVPVVIQRYLIGPPTMRFYLIMKRRVEGNDIST